MENKNQDILSLLSSSFLFRGLDPLQIQKLAQKTRLHTHKPGRLLLEEGVLNDKVFIVVEGLVKIYKITSEGKETFLSLERTHDYLGIMDLDNNPATASIETLTQTTVLIFHKRDLLLLLEKNPLLWKKMYHILVVKLEENIHFKDISQGNSLYQKTYLVLDFISRLSKNNVIYLSHEAIAQIVGATRPRVTEALHELREAKKIHISSKKITLLA